MKVGCLPSAVGKQASDQSLRMPDFSYLFVMSGSQTLNDGMFSLF